MKIMLVQIGMLAILQPALAFAFTGLLGENTAALPPFDISAIGSLGATSVVSLLLVWVITKDRPAERDAFLVQLRQAQADGYAALSASRTQFIEELSAQRAENSREREADRLARVQVVERIHDIMGSDIIGHIKKP